LLLNLTRLSLRLRLGALSYSSISLLLLLELPRLTLHVLIFFAGLVVFGSFGAHPA
jgi:hypothetical protein